MHTMGLKSCKPVETLPESQPKETAAWKLHSDLDLYNLLLRVYCFILAFIL